MSTPKMDRSGANTQPTVSLRRNAADERRTPGRSCTTCDRIVSPGQQANGYTRCRPCRRKEAVPPPALSTVRCLTCDHFVRVAEVKQQIRRCHDCRKAKPGRIAIARAPKPKPESRPQLQRAEPAPRSSKSVNAPVSWWLNAPAESFTARAQQEADRMRVNPQFAIATLGEANAFKIKRQSLRSAMQEDAA